jgi:hypothetical protein
MQNSIVPRLSYIAQVNPNGVHKLAYKYGYPMPKNSYESRMGFLQRFIEKEGSNDEAIDDLLQSHPDFNAFAETFSRKARNIKPENNFNSYDGFVESLQESEYDEFIGEIAKAVGGITTGALNKKGKKARAHESSMANKDLIRNAIEQRNIERQEKQKAKVKSMWIWGGVISLVLIILAVVLIIWLRKKK